MIIVGQDRDVTVIANQVIQEEHFYEGTFMGFNLYNINPKGEKIFLGTLEEDEVSEVLAEIKVAIDANQEFYYIPGFEEDIFDYDDVMLGGVEE